MRLATLYMKARHTVFAGSVFTTRRCEDCVCYEKLVLPLQDKRAIKVAEG